MTTRYTKTWSEPFLGAMSPATTANGLPWIKRDTSSSGSPTAAGVTGGGIALTLDNTSEAQIIGIDFGDALAFDIDELILVRWKAKIDATPAANVSLVMGMAGAYNATMDSVAQNCWFKMVASDLTVFAESDDGTNDNDDKSTGIDLVAGEWKWFEIRFDEQVQTVAPPGTSKGGKGNIVFAVGDSENAIQPVLRNQLFDMSNYSSGLQPYFQLQKASGTVTGTLTIAALEVEYKV